MPIYPVEELRWGQEQIQVQVQVHRQLQVKAKARTLTDRHKHVKKGERRSSTGDAAEGGEAATLIIRQVLEIK
jgi:hypothetical protein